MFPQARSRPQDSYHPFPNHWNPNGDNAAPHHQSTQSSADNYGCEPIFHHPYGVPVPVVGPPASEARKWGPPPSGHLNRPGGSIALNGVAGAAEMDDNDHFDHPGDVGSAHNSTSWSATEDSTLMMARSRGLGWADIMKKYFPSRTPNACRKRWERLMEQPGLVEKDQQRMQRIQDEYVAMRKAIWSPLAERMGESWEWVEAQCMSAGLKSIQSSARSHTHRSKRESRRAQQAHEAAQMAVQGPDMDFFGPQNFLLSPVSPNMPSPSSAPALPPLTFSSQPYPSIESRGEPPVVFGGYLNGKTTGRPSGRNRRRNSELGQSIQEGALVGRDVSQTAFQQSTNRVMV